MKKKHLTALYHLSCSIKSKVNDLNTERSQKRDSQGNLMFTTSGEPIMHREFGMLAGEKATLKRMETRAEIENRGFKKKERECKIQCEANIKDLEEIVEELKQCSELIDKFLARNNYTEIGDRCEDDEQEDD